MTSNSNITVSSSVMTNNEAQNGGAIALMCSSNCAFEVKDSNFTGNQAT